MLALNNLADCAVHAQLGSQPADVQGGTKHTMLSFQHMLGTSRGNKHNFVHTHSYTQLSADQ